MNSRVLIALVLLGASSACLTGPQRVSDQPSTYLSVNQPGRVWLTLNDESQLVVTGPRVMSDTLFGWNEGGTDLMIPVSDIKEVRARRMSIFRTALIPAAVVAGSVTMLMVIRNARGEAENNSSDSMDMELRLHDLEVNP